MNWRALGLTVLCVWTAHGELRAADTDPLKPAATPSASSPATLPTANLQPAPASGSRFQLAIYFVLLVALLGGGVFVMRNGLGFLQPKPKGPRKLEISETRMLGNRQFLIVAEYEQRKMLLGVCPGRIDYLCTLSGGEPEFPRLAGEDEG